MYTAFKRQRKHRVFLKFTLIVMPIIVIMVVLVWFIFLRTEDATTSSFSKVGSQVAIVKPQTKSFSTEYFNVTLPASWVDNGRKNPFVDEVYYEYQSKLKDYDNRWLRVYVDVFPSDFPISKVLPVTVNQNKLASEGTESISDECRTFTGAPLSGIQSSASETWAAKWKDVSFTCDMKRDLNYVGTASVQEGYNVSLINKNGSKHKYFLVYIDHNVRPDYGILTDAVKSFEVN